MHIGERHKMFLYLMYIFITNWDVIHEYKGIREVIYTILKMMNVEKSEKKTQQNYDFP